jgi:hypothetical protein
MNTIPLRIVIYSKDVMNITGCRRRTAQKLIAGIKAKGAKSRGGFVTVTEFCRHTGFSPEEVHPFLRI